MNYHAWQNNALSFLVVLGFELKASCLLGRHSIAWVPPLFFYVGKLLAQLFFLFNCCAGWGYKSSYNIWNISNLNSAPPSFSFILLPHSWNSFNRYHFSICIHVYMVFALCSSSYTLPHILPPPTGTNLLRQDLFYPPVLWFCKTNKQNDIFACWR
jgi:hypothetical protein